ncbi:protein of unknown function DUF937 [Gemmatirosa kalamazoonensis]|uniref:DUF937 domain-containing protein n=1 Tax=Gemmatirosa kalamazoonensis TaxID=861299 RepID=W0R9V0_9BACT|nr:DUF937 domain-containing protein [Gemmatirosa kalamazoonensis]AHG87884.1 protein of unknown function DUF937 [Gemmatirosa kalamazoonensis]
MSVLDLVQQHLGPDQIRQLSQQIGADPAQTETAVQAALPMLLGGMASTAQDAGGAQGVQEAMQQHEGLLGGLGGLGGSLGSILSGALGGAGGAGGGILGNVLGRHEGQVNDGVQQASGLDAGQTKKLLLILAPIVLAALAHQRKQQQQSATQPSAADLNADGIPDALQQEARQAQAQTQRTAPHIGGIVGKILDAATRH